MATKKQLEDNAKVKELSDFSRRITFCRKALGLTIREAANGIGLSYSTCFNREIGYMPSSIEEYEMYSKFFGGLWVERFGPSGPYPKFNGTPIVKITQEWFLWGSRLSDLEIQNEELRTKISELETKHQLTEADLLRQIKVLLEKE